MGNDRGRAKGFRNLLVWQRAMELAGAVYQVSARWPSEERYGLMSQARRASVSIAANLAKGQGRFGPGEFARFVSIAHGSLCELETELLLAARLGYSTEDELQPLFSAINETGKMARGLHDSLQRSRGNSKQGTAEDQDVLYE